MAIVVNRKPLTFWEKLYLPAFIGGLKVTMRHAWGSLFGGKTVTMEYPEQKWAVPEGYRGAPYLVRDQEGNTKCVSCQLCEFVCPPKAIKDLSARARPTRPPTAATRRRCPKISRLISCAASIAVFARRFALKKPFSC